MSLSQYVYFAHFLFSCKIFFPAHFAFSFMLSVFYMYFDLGEVSMYLRVISSEGREHLCSGNYLDIYIYIYIYIRVCKKDKSDET